MADKEATVYLIDVAKSMGQARNGRDETDLDWAMKYVWDKITATVATGRKTANVGVVAFRSDDTNNDLGEEEAYHHISVLRPLGQMLMPHIRELTGQIKPSGTDEGDAMSALVVAIQMISAFCRHLKYKRKIVLVTNALGDMDTDGVDEIASKIQEDNIELWILGADFDDPEYGVKEENKDPAKEYNERTFRSLAEKCNGTCGTLHQAVSELGIPRIKSVRPMPSYRGLLTLGNPEEYPTAMSIDVERYPRTVQARAPTASSFAVRSEGASEPLAQDADGDVAMDGDDLAVVRQSRTYTVTDENAPGGKRDVDRESLAKGYAYGQTAVPISEADENVTKFVSKASLDIMGFIPRPNHEHYMSMSRTNIVMAQRTNEKATLALSSFIRTLHELDNYAVARLVTKDDKDPTIVLLAPSIEPDFECLIDVELPFAEDVRSYKFPPLDRIVTISGKTLTEHRNLPNSQLRSAMDDYVASMDISAYSRDDDGNPCEYMTMEDTFSPMVHRISQAIAHRAVHPDKPTPQPAAVLIKYTNPPKDLLEEAQPKIDALKQAADVKKVPPKTGAKRQFRGKEAQQTRSGLDVSALLSSRAAASGNKISKDNAIPEFRQMIASASGIETVQDAVSQLGGIVEEWITNSMGDALYGRCAEALAAMKEECCEMEEPGLYNDFMRGLKKKLLGDELGGDRREFWWKVRVTRLGLIDKRLLPGVSDVDDEEGKKFYQGS